MSQTTVPIPSFDAWVLARLLIGHDPDGALSRVSESFRPLADRLAGLPAVDRKAAWDAFITDAPEGEGLVEAVAAPDPDGPAPEVTPSREPFTLVCLADAEPQAVEWLWHDRIPIGKVATLAGDPGLGKSFVTLWLAAQLSRGGRFPDRPDDPIEPGATILLSAEDDVSDTIRPRLDAAGADVSRVFAVTTNPLSGGGFAPFNLASDLPRLEAMVGRVPDVRLIVIDPVSAYLGESDENKNGQIRGLIAPLSDFAARHRLAVLLVTHMNKATGLKAIYRATGSLAFVAAARTVWLVAKDPADPGRRLMLPLKNNLAQDSTGLAFRITDRVVTWEPDPVTMTADEALSDSGGSSRRPSDSDRAAEWLRAHLADGSKPSEEVVEAGNRALGLKRALKWWRDSVFKERLKGQPRKQGFAGGWVWGLPGEGSQESEESQPEIIPLFSDPSPSPEPVAGPKIPRAANGAEEDERDAGERGPSSSDSWDSSDSSPAPGLVLRAEGGDR